MNGGFLDPDVCCESEDDWANLWYAGWSLKEIGAFAGVPYDTVVAGIREATGLTDDKDWLVATRKTGPKKRRRQA